MLAKSRILSPTQNYWSGIFVARLGLGLRVGREVLGSPGMEDADQARILRPAFGRLTNTFPHFPHFSGRPCKSVLEWCQPVLCYSSEFWFWNGKEKNSQVPVPTYVRGTPYSYKFTIYELKSWTWAWSLGGWRPPRPPRSGMWIKPEALVKFHFAGRREGKWNVSKLLISVINICFLHCPKTDRKYYICHLQ